MYSIDKSEDNLTFLGASLSLRAGYDDTLENIDIISEVVHMSLVTNENAETI